MCFRKKTLANVAKDDRELIAQNASAMEALIVLARDNADLSSKLKDLQERLKYLINSPDPKVLDYDKLIRGKLGDLRIALTKSEGESTKTVDGLLLEVELAIADRNAKL